MKKFLLYLVLLMLGAFLWWAFSPLILDKEVQDELDPALEARLKMQEEVDSRHTNEEASADTQNKETPRPPAGTAVFVEGPFPIKDTPGHTASGEVEIIHSPEETLIRYLDYDGTNGPDLKIYLSKDLEAEDYIDLGQSKGNKGTLIYGVPMDADLSDYKYILTWCEAFGVLFDYAEVKLN